MEIKDLAEFFVFVLVLSIGAYCMVNAYIEQQKRQTDDKFKTIKENEKIIISLETSQYEKDFNTLRKELEKCRNIVSQIDVTTANINALGCFPIYHTPPTYQNIGGREFKVHPGVKWSDLKGFESIRKPYPGKMFFNSETGSERRPAFFSTWINEASSITQKAYEKLNSHNKNKKMKRSEIKVKVNTPEEAEILRSVLKIYAERLAHNFYNTEYGMPQLQTHMTYGSDGEGQCWIVYTDNEELEEIGVKEFIEIISGRGFDPETKEQKIAVRVRNERQWSIMCQHFNAHGWNLRGSNKTLSATKFNKQANVVALHDEAIIMQEIGRDSFSVTKRGYKVLDFSEFAKLNNLPCPEYVATSEDGYQMYTGDDYYHAIKKDDKEWRLTGYKNGKYGGLLKDDSVIVNSHSNKMFKTEAAAQDFVRMMNCTTTSEDGYTLRRSDEYHFVHKRAYDGVWVYEKTVSNLTESSKVLNLDEWPNVRAFKTLKNAVEWCEKMNKPEFIMVSKNTPYPIEVRKEGAVILCGNPSKNRDNILITKEEFAEIIAAFDKVR